MNHIYNKKGNKDFKIFPEKVLTMVFDYGKVVISNEREVVTWKV